jgi:hypothetical protein
MQVEIDWAPSRLREEECVGRPSSSPIYEVTPPEEKPAKESAPIPFSFELRGR